MSNESFLNDHCLETGFTSRQKGCWKLSRRRSVGGKIETVLLRCAQYVHSSFGRAYYLVKNRVKSQVQRHHNPRVGGSNPSIATLSKKPRVHNLYTRLFCAPKDRHRCLKVLIYEFYVILWPHNPPCFLISKSPSTLHWQASRSPESD